MNGQSRPHRVGELCGSRGRRPDTVQLRVGPAFARGCFVGRLWHDDLYGMGESIDREVSPIDRQDLIDGRIVVHDGEHDGINKGE